MLPPEASETQGWRSHWEGEGGRGRQPTEPLRNTTDTLILDTCLPEQERINFCLSPSVGCFVIAVPEPKKEVVSVGGHFTAGTAQITHC